MKASQTVAGTSKRASSEMRHIVSTAQRLREVRKASRQFLLLWSLETGQPIRNGFTGDVAEPALSDPSNHDWSTLYLGSVLDD